MYWCVWHTAAKEGSYIPQQLTFLIMHSYKLLHPFVLRATWLWKDGLIFIKSFNYDTNIAEDINLFFLIDISMYWSQPKVDYITHYDFEISLSTSVLALYIYIYILVYLEVLSCHSSCVQDKQSLERTTTQSTWVHCLIQASGAQYQWSTALYQLWHYNTN